MTSSSPLVDFFKRGEAARDVRLMAAQGVFAPRAHDQLGILVVLLDDADPEIRATAGQTLDRIPLEALTKFLARSDVPPGLREFFAARGVLPAAGSDASDAPLIDVDEPSEVEAREEDTEGERDRESIVQELAKMTVVQRLKVAVKGSREARAILVRDNNKMIAAAVMSSPKLTEQEVEGIARMASVSEDVLRIIAHNRIWMKNYKIAHGLVKNPKTPVAVSMNLIQRLNARDLAHLSIDRNVPEPVRIAARKKVIAERP
jgi:hypothetical protein